MNERVATPIELAERNAVTAEYIQIELAKESPDLKQIETWCWHIRQRTHGIIYALEQCEKMKGEDTP